MENQTRFDLNAAVARWRKNLENSPALRPQDLEELEMHLRDSIQAMHARGLTLEEAFLTASQRLGPREELEREYGKVNVGNVWMHRATCMLLGLILLSLVAWCSHIVTDPLVQVAMSSSMSTHWIGFLSFAGNWAITALAVAALWRFVTRSDDRVARFAQICVRRPLLPIIGIVLLNYAWPPLIRWLLQLTSPGPGAIELRAPVLTVWGKWTSILDVVLWLAALAWLASGSRREKQVSLWRSKEHHLTQRAVDVRQIWIERGTWMLSGFLLVRLFLSDLYVSAQVALLKLAPWLSVGGSLFGFFAICVQWALVAGFLTAVWKLVTRSSPLRDRISRLTLQRWALSFIGLVLLYLAVNFGVGGPLRLLAHLIPAGPSYGDHSLALRWMDQGYLLLYNVISVAVLFWLARRQIAASSTQAAHYS